MTAGELAAKLLEHPEREVYVASDEEGSEYYPLDLVQDHPLRIVDRKSVALGNGDNRVFVLWP